MARHGVLHRLHQWLFVLGVVILAAPPLLTVSAKSAVTRNGAWAATMNRTLDSLAAIRDTATDSDQIAWLDHSLTITRNGLATAEFHLARSRSMRDTLWTWNGRGPLLIVVGVLFLAIGFRLRRFARYGI